MKMKNLKNQKAFTLIELLVVIAIISILASILFVAIDPAAQADKAKDAQRLSDMKSIQQALEMYQLDKGYYPKIGWAHSYNSTWNLLQTQLSPYLNELPKDPDNNGIGLYNGGYSYDYFARAYGGDGMWYMLVLRLKDSSNSIQNQDGVIACNGNYFHYGNGSNGIITVGGSCN